MHWKRYSLLTLLLEFLFLVPTHVQAQPDTVRIPYTIACQQCSLTVEKVATLGSPNDPVLLTDLFVVERDSRGRFFSIGGGGGGDPLRFGFGGDRIVVYGQDGKYLTAFGAVGSGPGEFSRAGVLQVRIGRGDTVYVFDTARRVHVFGPDFKFARTFSHIGSTSFAFALPDGGLVVAADVQTPANFGFPYHVFRNDSIIKSFGPETKKAAPSGVPGTAGRGAFPPVPTPRIFQLANDGRSIVVTDRYRFHRWGIDGRDLGVIEVVGAPWLPREAEPVPPIGGRSSAEWSEFLNQQGRPSNINFMGVDTDGLYWVLGGQPLGVPARGERQRWKYHVEVIDIQARRVLLSKPVDVAIRLIERTQYAYSKSTDSDGVHSFTVWRVGVTRP